MTTEREVERVEGALFSASERLSSVLHSMSLVLYVVCKKKICILLILFDFKLLSFHPSVTHSLTVRLCIASGGYICTTPSMLQLQPLELL